MNIYSAQWTLMVSTRTSVATVLSIIHPCIPAASFTKEVNTLRPRQDGCHFADDTFKRIFLNENIRISIKISLKFVLKVPINNIPSLVQIMAWPGDKPLSEPMMISLLRNICVTRPQWVNSSLANCELTSLVKEATGVYEFMISTNQMISYTMSRQFIRVMPK